MSLETYPKFIRTLLTSSVLLIVGLITYIGQGIITRLDKIQDTVSDMQGDNKVIIVRLTTAESDIKKNTEDNNKQDIRLTQIEAILNEKEKKSNNSQK